MDLWNSYLKRPSLDHRLMGFSGSLQQLLKDFDFVV